MKQTPPQLCYKPGILYILRLDQGEHSLKWAGAQQPPRSPLGSEMVLPLTKSGQVCVGPSGVF